MDDALRTVELQCRNDEGRSRWLHRRDTHWLGRIFPDPRNQEQRDLGVELVWLSRVRRNEAARQ